MPTTRDVQALQLAAGAADYEAMYGNRTPVDRLTHEPDPKSSAAQLAARVREDEQAAAEERDELLYRLQNKRQRREAERAKTAGLTTAEILAARRLGTG
jgi:hypothetical protein